MTASLRPLAGRPADVFELLEPWVRFGGEPIGVRTSGSTGAPKDVLLSHAAVLASARASIVRLGGPGAWVLALPVTGVAGLQVLVRSILSGTTPLFEESYRDLRSAFETPLAGSAMAPRTYTSLVPTQVHRLADQGALGLLSSLDAVLVGGASMSPVLRAQAAEAGVTIVRTYGMTETCGGCVYDGIPLDGVRVRIGEDQQVQIRGPVLFDGYLGEPRTRKWFSTADHGSIVDGVLTVDGRMDDVALSGGVNVSMPAVQAALRTIRGVTDVEVVGVEDAEWGTRVVAFLAGDEAEAGDLARLRDRVEAAGLPREWAPQQVLGLDHLPLLPGGKVDRPTLRQRAVDAAPA